MNSVTLTLPDTVYRQLERFARTEGLSMNQYLSNAVTAHAVANYRIHSTSETDRLRQRADFLTLPDRLGTDSEDENRPRADQARIRRIRARVKRRDSLESSRVNRSAQSDE